MKKLQLDIPLGVELKEEELELIYPRARALVFNKVCTTAVRYEDRVKLVRHYVECPYCGEKIYVYNKELGGFSSGMIKENEELTEEKLSLWYYSKSGVSGTQQEPLEFFFLSAPDSDLTCPECKNKMVYTNRTKSISLESHRHKVFIRGKVQSLDELLSLPFAKSSDVELELPLYEVLCFNFRNGHTYLRVENERGELLTVRDITHMKNVCQDGVVISAINRSYVLRKHLKMMFEAQWGAEVSFDSSKEPSDKLSALMAKVAAQLPFGLSENDSDKMRVFSAHRGGCLPFDACELGLYELRMLTAFMGYNREFYRAIPYVNNTLRVDSEFASLSRRMHKAKNAASMLEESALPCVKSVRRLFFKNQGLFFYIKECEELWAIFKDTNLLVSLLEGKGIFHILYELHCRPVLGEFLKDFARIKGKKALLGIIRESCESFCRHAVNYVSMSPSMRLKEQRKWRAGGFCSAVGDHPYFSIPMCKPDARIPNCTIDGFHFSWLNTTGDYQHAGESLHNCLKDWTYTGHPVVCVSKEGRIVGAIEVTSKIVFQARSADNEELTQVEGLKEAFDKWCDKYKLMVIDYSEFDDDIPDEIEDILF